MIQILLHTVWKIDRWLGRDWQGYRNYCLFIRFCSGGDRGDSFSLSFLIVWTAAASKKAAWFGVSVLISLLLNAFWKWHFFNICFFDFYTSLRRSWLVLNIRIYVFSIEVFFSWFPFWGFLCVFEVFEYSNWKWKVFQFKFLIFDWLVWIMSFWWKISECFSGHLGRILFKFYGKILILFRTNYMADEPDCSNIADFFL